MIDGPQQPLADPPDAARAKEDVGGVVQIADLQLVAIGEHIYGDPRAVRDDVLRAGLVDRVDEPAREILGIVNVERDDARARPCLVERKAAVDVNGSALGAIDQADHRLAGRKQEGTIIEIDFYGMSHSASFLRYRAI